MRRTFEMCTGTHSSRNGEKEQQTHIANTIHIHRSSKCQDAVVCFACRMALLLFFNRISFSAYAREKGDLKGAFLNRRHRCRWRWQSFDSVSHTHIHTHTQWSVRHLSSSSSSSLSTHLMLLLLSSSSSASCGWWWHDKKNPPSLPSPVATGPTTTPPTISNWIAQSQKHSRRHTQQFRLGKIWCLYAQCVDGGGGGGGGGCAKRERRYFCCTAAIL